MTRGEEIARDFFLRPKAEAGWEEDRAALARMIDAALNEPLFIRPVYRPSFLPGELVAFEDIEGHIPGVID